MTDYLDPHFVRALCRDPERRTLQDLQIIYYGLLGLEALRPCRDSVLRGLCKIVRYERHHANHVLYYTGELATSWYILLSGSVFIDGSMFLPLTRESQNREERSCIFLDIQLTFPLKDIHNLI
ncbi:RPGF factor, partial [Acromyrmex insinuator]